MELDQNKNSIIKIFIEIIYVICYKVTKENVNLYSLPVKC